MELTLRGAWLGPPSAEIVLVERACRGDHVAFEALHARWTRAVHAVLLSRLPPEEAREVVQDVFLSAWQRLPDLREPGSFGAWLLQIARNRARDHRRKRVEWVALPDDLVAPAGPNAEAAQMLAMVVQLPEAYRETLLMRLVEGLTGPEIAVLTGLTEGSVRVNLHRGMQLLRERLGGSP